MGGSIAKIFTKKLVISISTILGILLLTSILWGMIYFCGLRIYEMVPSVPIKRTSISLISAIILSLTTFSYVSKEKKIWDYIGTISQRIIAVLTIAFLLMLIEKVLIREFKIPGVIIISAIVLIAGSGFLKNTKIKRKQLIIKSPKITQKKKIVFISDIHVDLIYGKRHTQKIVNLIKKENPDIVLIGGDLVNSPKPIYVEKFQCFKEVKVPVYAVIGNHDVFFGSNTKVFEKICKAGNIIPLRNTSLIQDGLQIIGIDDKDLRKKEKLTDILEKCNIQSSQYFSIFLTHRPIHLSKFAQYPIDLELAGHTHNGQIRGLHFIAKWVNQGYSYGKYTRKDKIAFISQGLGAGIPLRIGTEGEIVVIHLTNQK